MLNNPQIHGSSGSSSRSVTHDGKKSNLRILIADDHEMIRQGLRRTLEQRDGWQVCGEAATGREAVELAKNLVPNIVILDLTMPELNGLEATD